MNGKKLITLLVTFCLVIGMLAPAAGAIQFGSEQNTSVQQGSNASSGKWYQDLLASVGNALGIETLRDNQDHVTNKDNISFVNGQWIATAADGVSVVLRDAQLPQHIQELRKAAEHYEDDDLVYAFVVLEEDPTAEKYTDIRAVPEAETASLCAQQDKLIGRIEKDVLKGQDLQVVRQFTHLTNSVVICTAFGNLEAIAALEGVKSVFLNPVYEACTTSDTVYPATNSAAVMTDVASVWQDLGYTGQGMTIAVLDTGLDLDHPSFAADPAGASWDLEWIQQQLDTLDLRAEELYKGILEAEDLYYNLKVPFAFNYALGNTNVGHNDGVGDHGTHVAGIAAANRVDGVGVAGMAPDAQIIVMKVFNSQTGGSNMFDLVLAIEDCLLLGVDVVNMSLGSPAGFSVSNIEEIDHIFARIDETDTVVDVAAGNEATSSYASSYGYYMQPTEYIDNATISSPSTYANAMSIASVDNQYVAANYFELADGADVFYMQSVEFHNGYVAYNLDLYEGQTLEYVIVPGLGAAEDFYDADGNSLVEGKVAVVKRGDLTFNQKTVNAEAAGALAILIWNNVTENIYNFGMTVTGDDGVIPSIPAALITLEDGQAMADAAVKTMYVSEEAGFRKAGNGGQMSDFSCWGVTPDLRLLPDLSGVGGNVYSCYDGGQYGIMSGTSMACPQIAGVTALVLQYMKEKFPDATTEQTRQLVDALLMSTAVTVIDQATNLEASPRQQGAGLANALAAITAEAYLSVEGSQRPKAELGDNENGSYAFTFTVHNFSEASKTYQLRASLLCEDFVTDDLFPGKYFMAEYEHALDNSAVTFSADSVTVAPGGTATVTVNIQLTDADKTWIDTYFANGNYVEGYVYLESENEVTLSLPFLGFYGQWDDSPVFDTGFWYQPGMMIEGYPEIEMNEYYHVLWTSLGTSMEDWLLGFNPYAGLMYEEDANGNPIDVIYDDCNNVISPNGDGVVDQISQFYLSLMRNAEYLTMTYTDEAGNVLHLDEIDKVSKTMYISSFGGVYPFVYSAHADNLYDFTDANGQPLPDGTTVYLNISGVIDYEGAEKQTLANIPLHIDTAAPVLDTTKIVESSNENGNFLTLTFQEAHPAYVALTNASGTQVYGGYSELDMTDNGDGTWSVVLDVTGLGNRFTVVLCDYGCNESYYDLTYTTDNAPEVSTDALYAYQVYNEYIQYYEGYDFMFGWGTIDKQTAQYQMQVSDAYEYYALIAAEYAGGYVFAVDAGGNFLYMTPGLWNRNHICNVGANVLDMAFDEVTQTMYLITKDSDAQTFCLSTIDLLTGEITVLRDYYSQYDMPWAMTFVDGNLYCCKTYYNGFYQVSLEDGSYDLVPVTDAEGNEFKPVNAVGDPVQPGYAQSMTYSKADGLIYWAYYSMDTASHDLLIIDPKTWTNTAVAFDFDQEYIGLLTLEDDGFTLPESTEVSAIMLNAESLILSAGEQAELTVSLLPWNAPVTEPIVWSSADESVATVVDGIVTAVGEGMTEVTATCGDLSVSCTITVIDISGNVFAYNYYSGDGSSGNWMNIDLSTMTYETTAYSPVDFIAAEYNGHDGNIYGFDESGQFYRYNITDGTCDALGAPIGVAPADMAYDYSTGLMYVIINDSMMGTTTMYNVNMHTGAMVELAIGYDYYLTLACDMYGTLFGINAAGQLHLLFIMPSDGGGIGGWEPWSTEGSSSPDMIVGEPIMQTPVEALYYAQSMCYDHVNDVILWTNPEHSTVYWLDFWGDVPYAVDLGDPSGTGLIEFTGMFVIPEVIEELPYVPVESIEAQDMLLLEGAAGMPAVSVYPMNATNQGNVSYVSSDESVVKVDNGMLVGVAAGTAQVTATVTDGEQTFESTFQVSVKKSTDNLYAYLVGDLLTGDGYYWINIDDANTGTYMPVDYVNYQGAYMLLYSAEYVDGKIYAYGYDMNDWEANFHFMVIDPATWSVLSAKDMGDEFPFIYDMAYNYTTGTMYALAGSSYATALYIVNMENGKLIDVASYDQMFMSLTVDEKGTIYAIAQSVEEFDPMTWESTYSNAMMYTLDPVTGEATFFMDTGVRSNMLSSMAYDFDTGYIYWHSLFQGSGYESGLQLIDLSDMSCNDLGRLGSTGAQITSLLIFADAYPETSDQLQNIIFTETYREVAQGSTIELETFLQPSFADVQITWSSADEAVAAVDENGVVTGVSAGTTTITATAVSGDKTFEITCTVVVYGAMDFFISFNTTDNGFSSIGRPDPTVVHNLTEAEEASSVTAMEMVDGVIYAFDAQGNLFTTSLETGFDRNYIGNSGIEVGEPYDEVSAGYYTYYHTYTPFFDIRDMAWDAVNGRMLAIGCFGVIDEYYYSREDYTSETYIDSMEETGGCRLYEVDLTTGALAELVVVGGDSVESGITMLTVDDQGTVYTYSYYHDYVMTLDTETGAVGLLSTFQNLGKYGSSDGDLMAMTYDPASGMIYILFTENGNLYYLYKFNPKTTALNAVGQVGTEMDSFAGLLINRDTGSADENPDTGDHMLLTALVGMMTITAGAVLMLLRKKSF